jgi:hypothetical protein
MTIATRPQPDTAVPSRPDPSDAGGSILVAVASGWWWLIWSAVKGVFKLVDAILSGLLWTLTGSARAWFAPLWVLGLAVMSTLAPESSWAWIGVASWLHLRPARPGGRLRLKLSARERAIVAKVAAVVGLVVDWRLSLLWSSIVLGAVMAVGSVPWLRGRRVRKAKSSQDIERWQSEVIEADPHFAGEWVEFNPDVRSGVFRSANMQGSELAKLDAEAERLLDQPAGTVTIAYDPRLSRRLVRITFTDPGDAKRFRFRDGPSLTRDGRFIQLVTPSGNPIYGRFWQENGRAAHIAMVAPTSAGKGGAGRHLILEAAPSPLIGVVGIDGKEGSGLGYLERGYLHLAVDLEDWKRTAAAWSLMLTERAQRFGAVKADSFTPTDDDPYLFLHVGELPQVIAAYPGIKQILKKTSEVGGSLGMGIWIEAQKFDVPSIGYSDTRSNILVGGWTWAGPAVDQQARLALTQGYGFDPMTLPTEPGWAAVMGRIFGGQPITPGRQQWTPNRNDVIKAVTEWGMTEEEACPFGTVEDILERDTVRPTMHRNTEAILATLEVLAAEDAASASGPEKPAESSDGVATITTLPPKPAPQPAPKPEAPAPKPGSGWARIVAELGKHPQGRTALEISTEVGLTKRHTSQLLSEHPAEAVQGDDYRWRLK